MAEQRARLIHGVASAVVEKGYVRTTVADIVRLAGVGRATFYELYTDKEDCFLDGYNVQAKVHFDFFVAAFDPQAHLADRLIQALTVYISVIDKAPLFSRAFNIAGEASTPKLREAHEKVRLNYCSTLKAWFDLVKASHPETSDCSEHHFTMLAAAVCAFASERIQAKGADAEGAGLALAKVAFGILGLYGWAQRCNTDHDWGGPVQPL